MHETTNTSADLRKTFSTYPTGVAFTAGHREGRLLGLLTNSFATVSLDPPLVTLSFDRASTTWPQLRNHPRLGISILGSRARHTLDLLRRPTSQRFDGVDIQTHDDGSLTLPDADAHLIVELDRAFEAGDHTMTLWKVLDHKRADDPSPLIFHGSSFHTPASL